MTFSTKSQDRANLNYYKEANSKIEPAKPGEKRVVFMGNSITEFWGTNHPEFFKENPYINRGINGQTTALMLMRFDADVIQLQPEVVVFSGGTYDIAENPGPVTTEQIMSNIGAMAQMAQTAGIKVILCSVLPVYQFYWRPDIQPIEQIITLNNLIKTYSEENGMVYADYYSALVNEEKGLKDEYTWDGIHPNREGYLVMELIIQNAIQKTLAGTPVNALPEIPVAAGNRVLNLPGKNRQVTFFTVMPDKNKMEAARNIPAKKQNNCLHHDDNIAGAAVREEMKNLS